MPLPPATAPRSPVARPKDRWIFGCGYLGERVAQRWIAQGDRVQVVTRSVAKAERLSAAGCLAHVADPLQPLDLPWTLPIDAILFSIGFDRSDSATIFDVHVGAVRRVLESLPAPPRVWMHVGTTGVYGDTGGEVVDESSQCRPDRDGGRAAWEAEELLRGDSRCGAAIILRMAGLYGPGRVPNIDALKRGEPLAANPLGWLNLIQIDDAAAAIALAADDGRAETYVVSDGHPVLRRDYYAEVARLAGIERMEFAPEQMGATKAARSLGSKRIDPSKIVKQLGFHPRFPSFREGLAHAFAHPTLR